LLLLTGSWAARSETYRDVLREFSGRAANGPLGSQTYRELADRLLVLGAEESDATLRYRAWVSVLLLEESGGAVLGPQANRAVDAIIDDFADDRQVMVPFVKTVLIDDRFAKLIRLRAATETPEVEAACAYAEAYARVHAGRPLSVERKAELHRDIDARIEVFGDLVDPSVPGANWSCAFRSLVERMDTDLYIGAPLGEFAWRTLAGDTVRAEDYRGRVLMLVFWSSTCAPCIAEFPQLERLASEFAGRPFAILGFALGDRPPAARKSIAEHGLTWPSVAGEDVTALAERLQVKSVPHVFLVDAEGRLMGFDLEPAALRRRLGELLER